MVRFEGDFDLKPFYKGLIDDALREIEAIDEAVRSGDLKGKWAVKEIDEPNTKGYIAYGQFWSETPLEPDNPSNPPWLPKRPIRPLRRPAIDETQKPLTDLFEDERNVKLYIHIPGVDKDDIQLNITDGVAEVKAKNFYTKVKLPSEDVKPNEITATYKNGVLEATIPKKRAVKGRRKHRIKIE